MPGKYILAVDQSTQGTKAILVDHNNQIFYKVALPHKQLVNNQGWVSHDLDEIRHNLYPLFRNILKKVNPDQIEALAITNQRESAAAWSRHTGEPLCHTIVWQDNRTEKLINRIAYPELKETVKNKTGLALSPYFTGAKWGWMLLNEPRVIQARENDDLCLGTMDSWLLYQLTNKRSFKTEPSNACRTQLMNIHTGKWDQQLCEIFGTNINELPEIVDSNAHFGKTDLFGLLKTPIPIKSILGDSQAALFAHGCFNPGDFKVTFGTGSSVMLNIGSNLPSNINNKLNTSIAWSLNGKISYVLEGNINYAGASISWLKDKVQLINKPEETENLALTANPKDHTILIPAFAGLGAPYWKAEAKAAFVNMTATTGKNELVKATLNSLVYQISDILSQFQQLYPKVNQEIHTDGGMIHNKYLMQYLCNITQKVVKIADIPELSALGSAMNARNKKEQAQSSKSFTPKMKSESAKFYLTEWHDWIDRF
ncbi:FGGY-family carbohydrate kinase [Lactobacillus jensenii]|uniref:FGGY-family carbohydrate kinase n=1 Tax=Lactobacillus jensenii TaxID=109790 RepID=UPI0002F8B99F|nr:FGGY family carbohydrate kinase [Lactobacillus jensenii]MCF1850751.1 glycerol kinase [Lactobacillus jensenii]MCZ3723636.1 glycerol kinase [Lactobacillus jensenii]MCZ3725161.1 glycerol kinase [Lactobacillus jensenii]MCZ3726662.1 glycerol kinase [Lactobacillus jensenii]MCZ3728243.1 glycerol kinase [Lactobacillus jensenii]